MERRLARARSVVSYFDRTYAEGKKFSWKDGVRAHWCLVRYGFSSRKN